MTRVLVFLLLYLLPPAARPPVEFLQPKARVILASVQGTEIPIQIRVEPHADNRAYAITWCGDGLSVHTLDGDNEPAVQPISPIFVRVFPGPCDLVATVYGPGHVVRARAVLPLSVCGDPDFPC